jgi:nitrous oxidase accessory protein NosD
MPTTRAHDAQLRLVVVAALAAVLMAAAPAVAATLIVAADGEGSLTSCDDASPTPFTTVGSAVSAAAAHDTVRVCPGVYDEQVVITRPLTLQGVSGAILKPAPMVGNTSSLLTGRALAAIVLVRSTPGVTVEGLIIDGADNGISSCAPSPSPFGIFFRNASGTIRHNTIRNMRLAPGGEACPDGTGILVQRRGRGASHVSITFNSIHDYQKNGMTLNESGSVVDVVSNVVTGSGLAATEDQAGIQLAFGATGQVSENTVTNHLWSACVSVDVCPVSAPAIIVFESSHVDVSQNVLGTSQNAVVVIGNRNTVRDNLIVDTRIYDGVVVFGNGNTILRNRIVNSAEAGAFVVGERNHLRSNHIQDAPFGLLTTAGNTAVANRFVNVPVLEETLLAPGAVHGAGPETPRDRPRGNVQR